MAATRPFVTVHTADQWVRCHHERTALDQGRGEVGLGWRVEESEAAGDATPDHAGLVFDSSCRLYRARPALGTVTRVLWAAQEPEITEEDLFPPPPAAPPDPADFQPVEPVFALDEPRGLAVDVDDRLFVGEAGSRQVRILDLWNHRLLRRVSFPAAPADLACSGRTVYVLLKTGALYRMTARTTPVLLPALSPAPADARAVAIAPDGGVWLLVQRGGAWHVVSEGVPPFAVPGATDLAFDGEGALVVARRPGQSFLRYRVAPGLREALPALTARGYDGRGVERAPDGRIAFFTTQGIVRHARASRLRFEQRGRITSFRLDSGSYQTQWGRVFLDACIPPGTAVRVRCVAIDEPPEGVALAGAGPVNLVGAPPHADKTPPQLPESLIEIPLAVLDGPTAVVESSGGYGDPVVRRETGRELPWARFAADDAFETYDTHTHTGRGRYLWVTLELSGDTRRTPRVRSLRVEHPGHGLLQHLPGLYRRDASPGTPFLQRYLALFDGVLSELGAKAVARVALVDPQSTPAELLPWLASFLGLVLDERWSESARRTLVAEATDLFRRRGTVAGLKRFLEIVLDCPIIILEHFRLRGLGGPVVGDPSAASTRAVLGAGFRVGGAIGVEGSTPLEGNAADAFQKHAHRFSVLIQRVLSTEELAVVRDLLDVHRPAHTVVDLCTVDAGMRVGIGLYAGLSSVIGRTGGFTEAQIGAWRLGRGQVVGRATTGLKPGASHIGIEARVG